MQGTAETDSGMVGVQNTLRAVNYYGGDKIEPTSAVYRQPTVMAAGTGAAPGQVPPDLPSLLLDARICYIGMPVSLSSTSPRLAVQ